VFHGAYTSATRYWRSMVREEHVLSEAEAVRRLTALPAQTMKLTDRGKVEVGAKADLAIFDHQRFTERGTTFEPNRLAEGMSHVIVNGVVTLRDGKLTGRRGGEVLAGEAMADELRIGPAASSKATVECNHASRRESRP
jgi:N-acyl-D-amino-acid deacylase